MFSKKMSKTPSLFSPLNLYLFLFRLRTTELRFTKPEYSTFDRTTTTAAVASQSMVHVVLYLANAVDLQQYRVAQRTNNNDT